MYVIMWVAGCAGSITVSMHLAVYFFPRVSFVVVIVLAKALSILSDVDFTLKLRGQLLLMS